MRSDPSKMTAPEALAFLARERRTVLLGGVAVILHGMNRSTKTLTSGWTHTPIPICPRANRDLSGSLFVWAAAGSDQRPSVSRDPRYCHLEVQTLHFRLGPSAAQGLGWRETLIPVLRLRLVVAPFRGRAFLLHLPKRLRHVFHRIPNINAHVDRRGLLNCHRDTIAGPGIYLDDLLLVQFILCTEDKSCKVRAVLQVVDDDPIDLRSKRSQDVRQQVMRQRSLPLRALHKYRNRYPDTFIDVDHENFFLIAKKNRAAAACRRHCADLHFDNGLAHVGSLSLGSMWLPATEFCGAARSWHATSTSFVSATRFVVEWPFSCTG